MTIARRAGALATAAALAVPIACWGASCALEGFKRADDGGATPPPSPVEHVLDGGPDDSPVCEHASYPSPPAETDPDGDIEFVVALRTIDFGESMDSTGLGLDLDFKCTCQGEGQSCKPAHEGDEACDKPGGRDAASGKVFNLLGVLQSGFSSAAFTTTVEHGDWTLLLRIRDYNGKPNDAQVRLDWYISTSFAAGGHGDSPRWEGADEWPVSKASLVPPGAGQDELDSPKYFDASAYVADGVLVGSFPEAELNLAGTGLSSFSLTIKSGILVAKVVSLPEYGGAFGLRDANLAGTWPSQELFRSMGKFRSGSGEPICTTDTFYSYGKTTLCRAMDINATIGSPTRPCDSISMGIGFTADPAKLGPVFEPAALSQGCQPPENDPANDACDTGERGSP